LFPLGFRYEVVFFKPSEPCGRKHNQRMSQWEYGKDIEYLVYKSTLAGILSFSGSERGTSSHCLKCSHQHKPTGRNWVLNACGFTGHRDLVGSVNMHEIAFQKKTTFPVSKDVTYRRSGTPCWKYLNRSSRRDTGHRKGFGPLSPALSEVCLESTTDSIRVPEGAGYIYVRTSEAISL
jgi:putative transposase